MGLFWKEVNWFYAYVPLWKRVRVCVVVTNATRFWFFHASFFHPFFFHPLCLYLSSTASLNILFLSMAEFRAEKGAEGIGGSDIMGFSCQIGSKSSLRAHSRAERGSRFLPNFYRGNDWGPSRPHQQPVIHWLLWYWLTVQAFTVGEMESNCIFCYLVF